MKNLHHQQTKMIFEVYKIETPFDDLIIILSPQGLCCIEFSNHFNIKKYIKQILRHYPNAILHKRTEQVSKKIYSSQISILKKWCHAYFKGKFNALDSMRKDIQIDPLGTPFEKKVWNSLLDIPVGKITTYGKIGKRLNCPSGQAIGRAVGKNPLAILIPCHRVIGKNKTLTGYAGGLDLKIRLLVHEGLNIKRVLNSNTKNISAKSYILNAHLFLA